MGAELVASVGILLLLLGGWVFSGEPMALAFSAAEVQFLFPAPLTRRGLISYKLFRAQLIILFNAVIWVFVLRRSGSVLAAPLRFLGTWMLFTNLSLHRLGAALVRTSLLEHGRAGVHGGPRVGHRPRALERDLLDRRRRAGCDDAERRRLLAHLGA